MDGYGSNFSSQKAEKELRDSVGCVGDSPWSHPTASSVFYFQYNSGTVATRKGSYASASIYTAFSKMAKVRSCFLFLFTRAAVPPSVGPFTHSQQLPHLGFVSSFIVKIELFSKVVPMGGRLAKQR